MGQVQVGEEGAGQQPARPQLLQPVVVQVQVGEAAQPDQAAAAQLPQLVVAQAQHSQLTLQ